MTSRPWPRPSPAYVASPGSGDWDVVDLRRLRCADPTGTELAAAFGALEMAQGWTLNVEREDVCPVATLPTGVDIETYLGTLGKKVRHEIRRKVRRAQALGEVRLVDSTDPLADLEVFIDLHQRRWGDDGLFPPTPRRRPEPRDVPTPVRALRSGRSARPDDAVGRRPADRRRRPLRDRRRAAVLQRRHRPGGARAVPRRADDPQLRPARAGARHPPDGLPAGRRAVQVRVGRGQDEPVQRVLVRRGD